MDLELFFLGESLFRYIKELIRNYFRNDFQLESHWGWYMVNFGQIGGHRKAVKKEGEDEKATSKDVAYIMECFRGGS